MRWISSLGGGTNGCIHSTRKVEVDSIHLSEAASLESSAVSYMCAKLETHVCNCSIDPLKGNNKLSWKFKVPRELKKRHKQVFPPKSQVVNLKKPYIVEPLCDQYIRNISRLDLHVYQDNLLQNFSVLYKYIRKWLVIEVCVKLDMVNQP